MAHQQHAELVAARGDLVDDQALALLLLEVLTRQFVHRHDRLVARVIGVVDGRAIDGLLAVMHGQVIGDRDRFVVRDDVAVERPLDRRPGAHLGEQARTVQVDRRVAAERVALAVGRQRLLVRAPAHLGGLAALGNEAVDRPGVDELAHLLRPGRDLRVALGDVDHLDAQALGELAPALARGRHRRLHAGVARQVYQRLLGEVRDEARIGAMGDHGRRAALVARLELHHRVAQRVVRTARDRQVGIRIAAGPRLDARVEVEHSLLLAKLDQRRRGDLDREVDQEIALAQAVVEYRADVGFGQALFDELDAEALCLALAAAHVVGDDGDLLGLDADMAQDQRQHALPDRAETHHDHAAMEIEVLLAGRVARSLLRHFSVPALSCNIQ